MQRLERTLIGRWKNSKDFWRLSRKHPDLCASCVINRRATHIGCRADCAGAAVVDDVGRSRQPDEGEIRVVEVYHHGDDSGLPVDGPCHSFLLETTGWLGSS